MQNDELGLPKMMPKDTEEKYKLGLMYMYGQEVSQDYTKALEYFGLAAEQGHASAQYSLGAMYIDGLGVLQDYMKALEYFGLAANQNLVWAQNNLGLMYMSGQGVSQDYTKALEYFGLAAEQGHATAQYNLGVMYFDGLGVSKNYKEALKYFHLAANQNYMVAQYNLGLMYMSGQGVSQDYTKALEYFGLAAEQGHATAQYNLGVMYFDGLGVSKNYKEALKYFHLAANQNVEPAQTLLASLSEEVLKARKSQGSSSSPEDILPPIALTPVSAPQKPFTPSKAAPHSSKKTSEKAVPVRVEPFAQAALIEPAALLNACLMETKTGHVISVDNWEQLKKLADQKDNIYLSSADALWALIDYIIWEKPGDSNEILGILDSIRSKSNFEDRSLIGSYSVSAVDLSFLASGQEGLKKKAYGTAMSEKLGMAILIRKHLYALFDPEMAQKVFKAFLEQNHLDLALVHGEGFTKVGGLVEFIPSKKADKKSKTPTFKDTLSDRKNSFFDLPPTPLTSLPLQVKTTKDDKAVREQVSTFLSPLIEYYNKKEESKKQSDVAPPPQILLATSEWNQSETNFFGESLTSFSSLRRQSSSTRPIPTREETPTVSVEEGALRMKKAVTLLHDMQEYYESYAGCPNRMPTTLREKKIAYRKCIYLVQQLYANIDFSLPSLEHKSAARALKFICEIRNILTHDSEYFVYQEQHFEALFQTLRAVAPFTPEAQLLDETSIDHCQQRIMRTLKNALNTLNFRNSHQKASTHIVFDDLIKEYQDYADADDFQFAKQCTFAVLWEVLKKDWDTIKQNKKFSPETQATWEHYYTFKKLRNDFVHDRKDQSTLIPEFSSKGSALFQEICIPLQKTLQQKAPFPLQRSNSVSSTLSVA